MKKKVPLSFALPLLSCQYVSPCSIIISSWVILHRQRSSSCDFFPATEADRHLPKSTNIDFPSLMISSTWLLCCFLDAFSLTSGMSRNDPADKAWIRHAYIVVHYHLHSF
ncbi:hypothetical protein F4604DRAFT_1774167 [Suillus subluteus]|nr:hypothetical protein F4604DRAFT_1774167 [Suillus subluteus]